MRCLKGGRSCEYTNAAASTIEFVQYRGLEDSAPPTPSSETWRSVIEQQLIDQGAGESREVQVHTGHAKKSLRNKCIYTDSVKPAIRQHMQASKPISDYPFVPISSLGDAFVSSIYTKLPPQDECQPLFESFILTIHPVIPICHIPKLRLAYAEFWGQLSPGTSAELMLLVLAILYTSSANTSSSLETSAQSSALYELYDELARALDLTSYYATHSPSSIMLLQGTLIMNTFRAGHLAPFTAFGFLPLAIRFAQSLRLHVDQNMGSDDDVDREVRRRLWWYLVFLDVESTIASGLPAIISSGSHTAKMPSMIITWAENSRSPMMIAMQGLWEWSHRMQIWFERKPEQHDIVQFGRVIESLLKLVGEGYENEEWARVYLQMLVDRAYCMVGLRFWQLDLFNGMGCHSEVVRYVFCLLL